MRLRPALALCLAAVLTAALCANASGAVLPPLAGFPVFGGSLTATKVERYKAAKATTKPARGELSRRVGRKLVRSVARAPGEARAASAKSRRVTVSAFTFGSAGAAAKVVTAYGAGASRARAKPKRVRVGAGGWAIASFKQATLVFREGAAVAVVQVTGKPAAVLPGTALGFAQLVAGGLRKPPRTAWQRVLDQVGPTGKVSRQTALQAFSLAYGTLPGVRRPSGKTGEIGDGTFAADAILRYRSSLTAAQRRVVDRRLGYLPKGRSARAAVLGDPNFTLDAGITATVQGFVDTYAAAVGPLPPGVAIAAGRTTTDPTAGTLDVAFADAQPVASDGSAGGYDVCRVRLLPDGQKATAAKARFALAHEAFHCMQYGLSPQYRVAGGVPPWLKEGMAEWAAYRATGTSFADKGDWILDYILNPGKPLFARTYDAVGFYGHVSDSAGDFLGRAAPTIKAGGNSGAAFASTGGGSAPALGTWGPSLFRLSTNASFTMVSPAAPPGFAERPPGGMKKLTDSGMVAAPQLATDQATIQTSKVFIHVVIDGPGRMYSPDEGELTDLKDVWLRTDGKQGCPDSTEGTPPRSRAWGTTSFLGIAGAPDKATTGGFTTADLSDFCKPKKDKPGQDQPAGCGTGDCGSSNGDPHIRTMDNLLYDFQAAGEFTLAKSATDDLEVQARQEPLPRTVLAAAKDRLSVNTAFAMRVAGTRVAVYRGELRPTLRVNGASVPVPQDGAQIDLPGGGAVVDRDGQIGVVWPDGTEMRVWQVGAWGVANLFQPAPARAGALRGLLGDFDGGKDDDLATRAGAPVDAGKATVKGDAAFKLLYTTFGDTWRIAQKDSLFDYAKGKSTASYTIKGFPKKPMSLADLTAAQRADAERKCRAAGTTEQPMLDDCILDVAASGDSTFGLDAATLQAARRVPERSGAWTRISSAPASFAGPPLPVTLDGAGRVLTGYPLAGDHALEVTGFTADPAGARDVARTIAVGGWELIGNPELLATPGGGTQLLFSGLHTTTTSDPLNGTSFATRLGDGSFGGPSRAATATSSRPDGTPVLAPDGVTPLWASGATGLSVWRGATNAAETDLRGMAPATVYNPRLAYDSLGRLWLAFGERGDAANSGIFMLQIDPSTGGPVAGATLLRAPLSTSLYPDEFAMACTTVCRVFYVQEDPPDGSVARMESWAPGEAAPTVAVGGDRTPIPQSATASPDGRFWLVWRVSGQDTVFVKLGNDRGAGGTGVSVRSAAPVTSGLGPTRVSSILAGPNRLALVALWGETAASIQYGTWAAVVGPGG
jgi:hypothetical protein